jgi:hypothetical protein
MDKGSARNMPVLTTDVMMLSVASGVDCDSENDEYDNGDNFQ